MNKKIINSQNFYRSLEINKDDVKETDENYVYTLKFASDAEYERWFGFEVLNIENLNLKRLNNNAVVLFNHDREKVIGVVEKAWIKDNIAYCDIRLSKKDESALKIKNLIDEKILTKVSFGYTYDEVKFLRSENDNDYYLCDVTAYEVSIVSIPADDSVGVEFKREFEKIKNFQNFENKEKLDNILLKEKNEEQINMFTNENTKNETTVVKDNVREILELGKLTDNVDLALKFIEDEKTIDEFKKEVAARRLTAVKDVKEQVEVEQQRNLATEIKSALKNQRAFSLKGEQRDYSGYKVEGKGKELSKTTFESVIQDIQSENLLSKAGFKIYNNVIGDLVIPVITGVEDGTWQTEEDKDIPNAALLTTNFRLEKETFTLPIKHSLEILDQTDAFFHSEVIEAGLKKVYTTISQKAVEKLLSEVTLSHTVTNNQITYKDILALEDKVWLENDGSFLASKRVVSHLKATPKFDNTGLPILTNNQVDGEDVVVNKLPPSSVSNDYLVYGDMSKFAVALYGYPQIYFDPIPDSKNQFTVKFVVRFGCKLVSPHALAKAEVTLV